MADHARRRRGLLAALALGAAGALAAPAAPAHALACGDTVTQDTVLTADLVNCTGDGLIVGAHDVTIDLDGHTISGTQNGFQAGVRVEGFEDVTVTDGTISQFNGGVAFDNADDGRVSRATFIRNDFTGVTISNSAEVSVTRSTFTENLQGVDVLTSDAPSITRNTFTGQAYGITISSGDGAAISRNTLTGQQFVGIEFVGIEVSDEAADVVLARNVASNTGEERIVGSGFEVNTPEATLNRNTAQNNTGDGINAVPGVSGSRNVASGNGGTECAPASLCD
jgi:parallel beta-helix repeat protein